MICLTFHNITTLTVTAKGQITLKRSILDRSGIRPGEKVSAEVTSSGKLEITPLIEPGPDIRAARGILYRPSQKALTIDEIKEGIEAGWAGER